ncbi:MAG: GlmU family protein [Ardenticatenales bacterium]|nr:GlmU family protein [Ardenticatenales bacterium]
MTQIILFEDQAAARFLPLAWTRPVFDLRCGLWTLCEAIEQSYGQKASALFVRDFLAEAVRERTGLPVNRAPSEGMVLLLNGRLLADAALPEALPAQGTPRRFVNEEGVLLGAWVDGSVLAQGLAAVEALPTEVLSWPLVAWPWELFQRNGERITSQAQGWPLGQQPDLVGVHLLSLSDIFIHPTAQVQPGVVLDATGGPILLEAGALVMANAVMQGPCYVGPKSTIKIGAKIYHGSTFGPHCKVGGEIEETIIHGYSNKQHDGFLGHAYLGEWCNLGADTNNSDLKNNYGSVSIWCEGDWRDTGSMFVGLLMGDHSKTGINSMLNTGTVVGISSNLFGGSLPPRLVPSFSWGGADGLSEYRLDKALETAEKVMARRKVVLSDAERRLLTHIFDSTAAERNNAQGTLG